MTQDYLDKDTPVPLLPGTRFFWQLAQEMGTGALADQIARAALEDRVIREGAQLTRVRVLPPEEPAVRVIRITG